MATINFSGLASGIDFEALISATSDAQRAQRALPNQKKVQDLGDTNTALSELKSKLNTLKSKIATFASLNGGPLSKSSSSSDETIITASASNAAPNGTYSITVSALAKSHTLSFNDRFAASDSIVAAGVSEPATNPGGNSRSIAITVGSSGTPFYVDVSQTTKLSDIADAINSANQNVVATVVNTGQTPNPYALILKSTKTGVTDGDITVTTGVDLAAVPIFQNVTEDAAQNASFAITGVSGSITSATNTVTGVIPGVTLNLVATTVTAVTVGVADDVAGTTSRVQEFVNAYNEIITYLDEQNKIERVENGERVDNIFGPLSTSRIDENAIQSLRTAISEARNLDGTTVRIFADLGIKTKQDGTLEFKTTELSDAISNDSFSVDTILRNFADAVSSTGGTIDQYAGFNNIIDTSVNTNKERITDLNDRIADIEAQILQNEANMRARFSRLESLISRLQQQGAAATSALAGLS
jgi:flagellar hook-associated protein 2